MIVLDTSFLVAFYNSRDVHHAAAVGPMAEIIDNRYGTALLPEYVLAAKHVASFDRSFASVPQITLLP